MLSVLGSGGMIYESLTLYSVSIVFDRCPAYRSLVLSSADLFVSGLQVLFLVKFLSVGVMDCIYFLYKMISILLQWNRRGVKMNLSK